MTNTHYSRSHSSDCIGWQCGGDCCDCGLYDLPRIFIYLIRDDALGGLLGFAIAEDGTGLVAERLDAEIFARTTMGIHRGLQSHAARKSYNDHYPQGYVLIDLVDKTMDEVLSYPGFAEALERHKAVIKEGAFDHANQSEPPGALDAAAGDSGQPSG